MKSQTRRQKMRKTAIRKKIRQSKIQTVIRLNKSQMTQTILRALLTLHPIHRRNLAVQARTIRNQIIRVLEKKGTPLTNKLLVARRATNSPTTLLRGSPVVNQTAINQRMAMSQRGINRPATHPKVIHHPRQRKGTNLRQSRAPMVKSQALVNRANQVSRSRQANRGNQARRASLQTTRSLKMPRVQKRVAEQAKVTLVRMHCNAKKKTLSIQKRGSILYWRNCETNATTPTKSCFRDWAGTNSV